MQVADRPAGRPQTSTNSIAACTLSVPVIQAPVKPIAAAAGMQACPLVLLRSAMQALPSHE